MTTTQPSIWLWPPHHKWQRLSSVSKDKRMVLAALTMISPAIRALSSFPLSNRSLQESRTSIAFSSLMIWWRAQPMTYPWRRSNNLTLKKSSRKFRKTWDTSKTKQIGASIQAIKTLFSSKLPLRKKLKPLSSSLNRNSIHHPSKWSIGRVYR